MSDTVEVEAQGAIYDAGEGVYREAGDVFEVAESAVGKHGGLLKPTDETDQSESKDSDATEDLTDLDNVGDATADKLREAGYDSPVDVRSADAEALADVDGISEEIAESLTSEE